MSFLFQGRTWLVLLALCSLGGCVSTKIVPVDHKALAGLQGGTVVVSQREKPSFAANTAGKMMFGAVGAVAAISSGNDIIRDNDVADPAGYIEKILLNDLVTDNALKGVTSPASTNTTDVAKLAKQYAAADLLLDVQTVNWSWIYYPTSWSHYKVIYSVKIRLIDTKHSKLIADGFCARVPDVPAESAPTKDELLENKAARLKQELATAADYCVQTFRTKVLEKS